jgi:hypothetical protein
MTSWRNLRAEHRDTNSTWCGGPFLKELVKPKRFSSGFYITVALGLVA